MTTTLKFAKDFDYVPPKSKVMHEMTAYKAGETYDAVPDAHATAAREAGVLDEKADTTASKTADKPTK